MILLLCKLTYKIFRLTVNYHNPNTNSNTTWIPEYEKYK